MSDKTNIEIRTETWRELNQRKQGPSDTFDAVIQRLLAADTETEPARTN